MVSARALYESFSSVCGSKTDKMRYSSAENSFHGDENSNSIALSLWQITSPHQQASHFMMASIVCIFILKMIRLIDDDASGANNF